MRRLAAMLGSKCTGWPQQHSHAAASSRGALLRLQASSEATLSAVEPVVAWRQALLARAPTHVMKLRGVSFKQEAVAQLSPGQAVVVAAEPSNPADPCAMAAYTSSMAQLGYVPAEQLPGFPLPVCFGRVVGMGRARDAGLLGATVAVKHTVHGVWLDLLPDAWQDRTQLEQVVGREAWQQLQQQALQLYGHRCAITSAPAAEQPLQVVPQWGFDLLERRVYLGQLLPVCEPVLALKRQLADAGDALLADQAAWRALPDQQGAAEALVSPLVVKLLQQMQVTDAERDAFILAQAAERHQATAAARMPVQHQEALALLQRMMEWPAQDCVAYVQEAAARRQQLADEGAAWQLRQPTAEEVAAALAVGARAVPCGGGAGGRDG